MMTVRFAVEKLGVSFNGVAGDEGRGNCQYSWVTWAEKLVEKSLKYDRAKI